jgi:hypothetical protein
MKQTNAFQISTRWIQIVLTLCIKGMRNRTTV